MILDRIFKNDKGEFIDFIDVLTKSADSNNYIYTMAEAHAIDLIAKTIAKTELLVYAQEEEKTKNKKKSSKLKNLKNDIYYYLNIQPNYNENGTNFMYKLALKLLLNQEALVIINEKKDRKLFYVADSFNTSNEILYGKTFSNIVLSDSRGDSITLDKTYNQENAIYISIDNPEKSAKIESFKKHIGDLAKVVQTKYKRANTSKWRLKKPGNQPKMIDAETGKEIEYKDYVKKITEGLHSDEEAVILLAEAFDLINLNKDVKESLGDYKDIFKIIGDTVANIFDIPQDIFWGNKTEKSTSNNDFITFAVDFYFELIEDSLNGSLVGLSSYVKGERIAFNKYAIFHKDILEGAAGIDKLISNTFSRNEINEFLKLPYIDEEWANEHNLTKNYANVKGGDEENG